MSAATTRSSAWQGCLILLVAGLAVPTYADKNDKNEEKPDYKPFKDVTEGYERIDGFFPLYFNEKTDHLLAVVPRNMVGTDFLMARSLASAGRLTGYQIGHDVVRWEEFNKKMLLIAPDLQYLRGEKSTIEDVIARTYREGVIMATPIVTMKGNDPVIDLDKVFKRDWGGMGRFFGGKLDASISKWANRKGFPDNNELAVEAVFMERDKTGRKVVIHYSLSRLPATDYKPREADDRIGYFLTARKDWTADYQEDTIFKRYIHRWHLRKAEPDKAVSDVKPNDQIVFYIEKTVPVAYRRFIREGILMWNQAFEKAGLRNAVQVRQQTKDNEFAHLDPEDVNYNFFRWIVSGRAFAMGPSRANPNTGQILDADIIMDDSMARVWSQRYHRMTAGGPSAYEDPRLAALYAAHPEWRFNALEQRLTGMPDDGLAADEGWETQALDQLVHMHAESLCTYADGSAHEMALGVAMLEAAGGAGPNRDAYVGQWIKLVAAHEVGHTLGLRHNFKASSWKALADILANEDPTVPTTASVMDYNPGVYNADRTPRALYVTQVAGPYDELAIAYGYSVPGSGDDENAMLAGIAAQVAEKGLAFATDEDASMLAPDPLVNVYDFGDNPMAWAAYRMALVNGLRADMEDWAVEDGDSYFKLRQAFDMFLFELTRVSRFVARTVGGQYLVRDHKGDPNARSPITLVPASEQRTALGFLNELVFSESAFHFDPGLLAKLAPGRWRHWDSDAYDRTLDYPIQDRIAAVQYWSLFLTHNPATVNRIFNASLKVGEGEDAVPLAEVMNTIARSVWSELERPVGKSPAKDGPPFIHATRRNLQRQHLSMLQRIVLSDSNGPYPADAIALSRVALLEIAGRISTRIEEKGMDATSFAHLVDSETRILKMLDAGYQF